MSFDVLFVVAWVVWIAIIIGIAEIKYSRDTGHTWPQSIKTASVVLGAMLGLLLVVSFPVLLGFLVLMP